MMLHLIVNPKAALAEKTMPEIEARLRAEGMGYCLHRGKDKQETRAIAHAVTKERGNTVVAVGGDGTLCDVLTGIADVEGTILGLLPLGTGNDFAAAAKIPEGAAALDVILHGEAKYTDFIELDGGLRSMNIAGLGIDADVLERCYRMKHGGAKSKYFRGLLAALCSYQGQRVKIEADGETIDRTAFIAAVCNGSQFGGGIPICPPAKIDDGKLDLVVVQCPKRIKILGELIRLKKGKILERPISRHFLCETVRIEQSHGTMMQLDGELVASQTLTARVVHGKLQMYRG